MFYRDYLNTEDRTETFISGEDISYLATMAYFVDRSEMRRWLHQVDARITQLMQEGWDHTSLYWYGVLREKLESKYGLNSNESAKAVGAFPIHNKSFWSTINKGSASEKADQLYGVYSGVTRMVRDTDADELPFPEDI